MSLSYSGRAHLVLVMAIVVVQIQPAMLLGEPVARDGTYCAESKYAVFRKDLVSKEVVMCDVVAEQQGYSRMREEARFEGSCKGDVGPGR